MNIMLVFLGTIESGPVFTLGFAKGLQRDGIETYAVVMEAVENKSEWIKAFDSDHLYFIKTTPKKKKPVTSLISFSRDLLAIRKKFSGVKFKAVVSTFINRFDFYIKDIIKPERFIIVCHDPIAHSSEDRKKTTETETMMSKADDIIVMTKDFVEVVKDKYKLPYERIHYIRHGLMDYPPLIAADNHNNEIHFLFFGRIDGYKGLHILSQAFHKLSNHYSNVRLTIAGSGDFSSYSDEFLGNRSVEVINRYIKEEEVPVLFGKNNTIAVIPYTDATQSGVIPIAFFYGIPVIVSDTGGLREQLFDGKYGVMFKNKSPDSLYEKMKQFVDDNNLYRIEVEKMIDGRNDYQWSAVLQQFVSELGKDE